MSDRYTPSCKFLYRISRRRPPNNTRDGIFLPSFAQLKASLWLLLRCKKNCLKLNSLCSFSTLWKASKITSSGIVFVFHSALARLPPSRNSSSLLTHKCGFLGQLIKKIYLENQQLGLHTKPWPTRFTTCTSCTDQTQNPTSIPWDINCCNFTTSYNNCFLLATSCCLKPKHANISEKMHSHSSSDNNIIHHSGSPLWRELA